MTILARNSKAKIVIVIARKAQRVVEAAAVATAAAIAKAVTAVLKNQS
jgi:hypothetical protein